MTGNSTISIAIASGKGGTGKTTIAAHMAKASSMDLPTRLVDLDVEAPDAMLYFPEATSSGPAAPVMVKVPRLVETKCTGCGACAKACRFGSVLALGGVVTIDARTCKGCGRCVHSCAADALIEVEVAAGETSAYWAGPLAIVEGRLAVGDIRSTMVIDAAKSKARAIDAAIEIRDCPPGTTCPAAHAIEGADFALLVVEPTGFSLHDAAMAIELAASRSIPAAVVCNKRGFGTADVAAFCSERGIDLIGGVDFTRSRASEGASGRLWSRDSEFSGQLRRILRDVVTRVERAREAR